LEDVQAEGLKRQDPVYYEEQRKAGYIKGVEENRPAVISINTQFAGFAINESIARQRTAFAVTTGRRPTRFLQSLQKGRHVGLRNRIIRGLTREIADASHAPRCCECATTSGNSRRKRHGALPIVVLLLDDDRPLDAPWCFPLTGLCALSCECRLKRRGSAAFRGSALVSACGIWLRNAHFGSLSPRAVFGVSF